MENKEMNTEKIKFYKKHPVLLAWLISIFIGLGYALFTIIASVIHYEQRDYVWEIIKGFYRNVYLGNFNGSGTGISCGADDQ